MSKIDDAMREIDEVIRWMVDRTTVHGEGAIAVTAWLDDGRSVYGSFTTVEKDAFGGVQFAQRKDIPRLMTSKIRSVLAGTADVT